MFTTTTTEVSLPDGGAMIVEKDVAIPMRDGAILYADVFRPKEPGKYPALLNITCYQKDKLWVPPPDLEERADPHHNWETVTPSWWVPRGYACVRVDTRGSGKSPGLSDPGSWQEALDFYDAIEWAAKQDWCSGNCGTAGISYHATSQWKVAGMNPPSLKAIMPWEGWADAYRDSAYHGGIFGLYFIATWTATHIAHHLLGKPSTYNPDAFRNERLWQYARHNLDTGWWDNRKAHWDKIEVPLYSVGNWSGMALHLRGNVEGFVRAKSKHKKLRIHTGTHYHPFYSEEGKKDQLRFWDHWLKGKDTGLMDEPPVKLLIRTGGGGPYQFRHENEWPLARTKWTRFYLKASDDANAVDGSLAPNAPAETKPITYGATGMAKGGAGAIASSTTLAAGVTHRMGISFETAPLESDTEVTGPINLVIWVSSTTEDMDIFATLRNVDAQGNDVWETGQQGQQVPVAKGWLRVSQRELDPELSLPYRPYHKHQRRLPLDAGKPVECQVEIWPTCMVFKKSHRIRLDVQPRDGVGSAPYTHYHGEYNTGQNTVYTGGDKASYLLLPIIPAKS